MIKNLATNVSVCDLCELFGVSTSGYYDWLGRKPSNRDKENRELGEQIMEIHRKSRKTYGNRRVTKALHANGNSCGKARVARLMKENGLQGVQKARFKPRTTDSRHEYPISPNRLPGLTLERANQVWVTDITYIPTKEGWMYLAAYMDLKTRKIKGWMIRDHMRTELVLSAFRQAVFREKGISGLIVHSDRGSQYASHEFREDLEKHQVLSSMSAQGHCYDNAAMESFWSSLKADLGITRPFDTKEEARMVIFDYIEVFYNRQRIHSSIGDLSPLDYEASIIA